MIVYEDIVQGSPEWFGVRMGRPTASEFRRVITAAKGKLSDAADGYIDQLIAEAILHAKNLYPEHAENYTSRATEWGQMTEDEARRWYALETGCEVVRVGFVTTDDSRFGCSPDALIRKDGSWMGGLELKCPYEPEIQVSRLRKGVLPLDAKQQVHGSLAVSGLPWWDYVSYYPALDPFRIRVVPDAYTTELKVALELFHGNYVQALARVRSL